MTANTTEATEHAVIVAFETGAQALPAIALAAALASSRHQTLHGLFIEDEDLLKVARLPFARELHTAGGGSMAFSDARLRRALARLREEYRVTLEEQARQLSLNWSYTSMRGSRSKLAQAGNPSADILVIAAPVAARAARERILVLDSTHPGSLQTLASILDSRSAPTEVLVAGEEVSETLAALVAARPGTSLHRTGTADAASLLRLPATRPTLVLAPRNCTPARLQPFLRRARCPVLLAP